MKKQCSLKFFIIMNALLMMDMRNNYIYKFKASNIKIIADEEELISDKILLTTIANGKYVGFNTTKDGKHTLTLKEEADVYDVLKNKNLGRFKTKTFDLKMGDVKLFRLSK